MADNQCCVAGCVQKFGSETALSMHLKDKHMITDPEETARILKKSDSTSYKLSSAIVQRKKLIMVAFAAIVITLSVSAVILQFHVGYPAPNLGNMSSAMMASMRTGGP